MADFPEQGYRVKIGSHLRKGNQNEKPYEQDLGFWSGSMPCGCLCSLCRPQYQWFRRWKLQLQLYHSQDEQHQWWISWLRWSVQNVHVERGSSGCNRFG